MSSWLFQALALLGRHLGIGPPESQLCEYCVKIPFRSIADGQAPIKKQFRITHYDHASTRCPFCRLIMHAINQDENHSRLHRGHMSGGYAVRTIEWETVLSPGCRPAFRVHGRRGAWIAFGHDPHRAEAPGPRYLRARVPPMLDIDRVASWINHCAAEHKCIPSGSPRYFSLSFPGLKVLRLIDVRRIRIVETNQPPPRYVALSYVWGGVTRCRLTSSNRTQLMEPFGLDRDMRLPGTIRDAIELLRRLRLVRYLWVDSLCLVQDDPADLARGFHAMGRIYELAALTIVAACGDNADAGLPGVMSPRDQRGGSLREVQPGIFMGVFLSLDHLLERSVYQTRAWTMQEYLFSRRVLCFLDGKVFFRCKESERLESCHDAQGSKETKKPLSNMASRLTEAMDMDLPLGNYGDILMYYSRRSLTIQGDALRAMEGISAQFSNKLGYGMLFGLPIGALDAFILFSGRNLCRRPEFPSYSWAGWKGGLSPFSPLAAADADIAQWLRTHTWIVWYTVDGNGGGGPSLVWDPALVNTTQPERSDYVQHGYRERLPFSCNGLALGEVPTIPSSSTPSTRPSQHYSVYLRFWTVSILLSIAETRADDGNYKLLDKRGRVCGDIILGASSKDHFSRHNEANVKFNGSGPYELLLLSGVAEVTKPSARPRTAGDHAEYNVILLQWDGDVAERRGVGRVTRRGLFNSLEPGPRWKEITLA